MEPRKALTMNTNTLRSKRILIPTGLAVLALGAGGVVWAGTASAGDLRGSERDRVASAAVKAVGGGEAIEVETSDDGGEAFEVEVRKADGTVVEVDLDDQLKVRDQQTEDSDGRDDARDDRDDARDADSRALTAAERDRAAKTAVAEVGGGTVTEVEGSDDPGEAYEVEVRGSDGRTWDLKLDSGFSVVRKTLDD